VALGLVDGLTVALDLVNGDDIGIVVDCFLGSKY